MTDHAPTYNTSYTKTLPPDDDHPRGCSVYCDADDPDADQCIIKVGHNEFTFDRSTFDPKRWELGRDRLESALQHAFDQGRSVQRQIIRDALGMPTGWGGALHGRSGH